MKISKFLLAYHIPVRLRLDSCAPFAPSISSKPILVLTVTNCNASKRRLRRWILPICAKSFVLRGLVSLPVPQAKMLRNEDRKPSSTRVGQTANW
jgi:hypothetical protein